MAHMLPREALKEITMTNSCWKRILMITVLCGLGGAGSVQSAESLTPTEVPSQAALFKKFEQTMNGAVLAGQFTILGKDRESMPPEEYTIKRVSKLPDGDYWLFQARIKYGDKDVTIPLPLEVKWAGDTPVITLTDLTIPALGTFSARVVIDNGKYAGTWTHGDAGGHMFGVIKRNAEAKPGEGP
jgi:hypothetical protein